MLFQPLTVLRDIKCKRCGLYEKDAIKADDIFDEWELCASDFTRSDGKYVHFKDKEFNATFLCPECVVLAKGESSLSLSARLAILFLRCKTLCCCWHPNRSVSSAVTAVASQHLRLHEMPC